MATQSSINYTFCGGHNIQMALCGISLMSIKPVVFAQNCVFLNSGICRARFQHVHKISNAAVVHREPPRRPESSKRCNFCQPGGRAGNGLCNGDSETQISQRLTSPTPPPFRRVAWFPTPKAQSRCPRSRHGVTIFIGAASYGQCMVKQRRAT